MTGYKGTGDNKVHSASLLFDTKLTFTFFSNGSAQVELIDFWFTCSIYTETLYTYTATPLDRTFSFSMCVARSQTKLAISKAKHTIGLKPSSRVELIKDIVHYFHKKSHMPGFLIDGHIYCMHMRDALYYITFIFTPRSNLYTHIMPVKYRQVHKLNKHFWVGILACYDWHTM